METDYHHFSNIDNWTFEDLTADREDINCRADANIKNLIPNIALYTEPLESTIDDRNVVNLLMERF
jgi:hypothetical protein